MACSLHTSSFFHHLESINSTLATAQTRVTFWGARVVVAGGGKETISLDEMAKKIIATANKVARQIIDTIYKGHEFEQLTPGARIAGIEIIRKLQHFYEVTDEQVDDSNFFTRLLVWIREFRCINPYTTRFLLFGCGQPTTAYYDFLDYTRQQFFQQYGEQIKDHPAAAHPISLEDKTIRATEKALRALVRM